MDPTAIGWAHLSLERAILPVYSRRVALQIVFPMAAYALRFTAANATPMTFLQNQLVFRRFPFLEMSSIRGHRFHFFSVWLKRYGAVACTIEAFVGGYRRKPDCVICTYFIIVSVFRRVLYYIIYYAVLYPFHGKDGKPLTHARCWPLCSIPLVPAIYTGGELQITVLATGFEDGSSRRGRSPGTAR